MLIIHYVQLKNKAMKSKSKNDVIEDKKQRNKVVRLKKHCKKEFFDNLEKKQLRSILKKSLKK